MIKKLKPLSFALLILIGTGCSDNQDLFSAVSDGKLEVVEKVIRMGTSVNVRSAEDLTPLMIASFYGHDEIVRFLLERDAKVNLQDKNGFSALHIAAQNGNLSTIKMLCEYGADVTIINNLGWPPLIIAVQDEHVDVARFLSERTKLNQLYAGVTPLYIAAVSRNYDMVELLLEAGADPDVPTSIGETPRELAINEGYSDIASLFDSKSM